jgi:hypothetical protein
MMPHVDGFEVLRLLRKSQTGRSIPVVVVTAKELTEEDRQKLSGSVQKIIQKGAATRDEMLADVRALVGSGLRAKAKAKPHAEAAAAPRQPERSAPVPGDNGWAEREAQLKAEAEAAKQQLRDQQQTVELLQEEFAEAYSSLESMRELEQQVERLKGERDAAVAEAKRAAEEGAAARKSHDEEILRRRKKKVERALQVKSESHAVAVVAPPAADEWHYVITDKDKQTRCGKSTAGEVREWVAAGKLAGAAQVLLSRKFDGPYHPLSAIDEFKTVAPKSAPLTQTPVPAATADIWFVMIHDKLGQVRRGKAVAAELREWVRTGRLAGAAKVLLSRKVDGPYELLADIAEFRDVARPTPAPQVPLSQQATRPLPRSSPSLGIPTPPQVKAVQPVAEPMVVEDETEPKPAGRTVNVWLVTSLVAAACAIGAILGRVLLK